MTRHCVSGVVGPSITHVLPLHNEILDTLVTACNEYRTVNMLLCRENKMTVIVSTLCYDEYESSNMTLTMNSSFVSASNADKFDVLRHCGDDIRKRLGIYINTIAKMSFEYLACCRESYFLPPHVNEEQKERQPKEGHSQYFFH